MLGLHSMADIDQEETRAAIFDFDGVLFNDVAHWKVTDIRLGRLGERINWQLACNKFAVWQARNPELLITDCFTLDEFEFSAVNPLEFSQITPPVVLIKTAHHHKSRHHDLFLLSHSGHRDLLRITERLVQDLRFPVLKNPFEEAGFLQLSGRSDKPYLDTSSFHQARLDLLEKHLRFKGRRKFNRETEGNLPTYNKIFYYYTDLSFGPVITEYLDRNHERLEDGRTAIVPSYIARPNNR